MLEETKKIYEESANLYVKDWKSLNKNELVRQAIFNKDTKYYDGYVSAIMLRYWGKMLSYYHRCKLVATVEDVHMWMTQAVMYALKHHPWTDPKSSIFEDENGPDKVINRVFESKRLTFYQQLNRYNRKINSGILSIEALSENTFDTYVPMSEDEHTFIMDDLVIKAFSVKDYFVAFFIDAIITERYRVGGRHKALVTHFKHLENHSDIFSGRYDLNPETVKKATTYITCLSRSNLIRKINRTLSEMRRKLLTEQSGVFNDREDYSKLYDIHKCVQYYYTELWEVEDNEC